MTALLNLWGLAMDSYTDEDGKWEPCVPADDAFITVGFYLLRLTPVVAFLYFLLF